MCGGLSRALGPNTHKAQYMTPFICSLVLTNVPSFGPGLTHLGEIVFKSSL